MPAAFARKLPGMKTLLMMASLSIFTLEVIGPPVCDNPDGGRKKKKDGEEGEETFAVAA
jgi:hypothetical protein